MLHSSKLLYKGYILFTTHDLLDLWKTFFPRQLKMRNSLQKEWQNEEAGRYSVTRLKWVLSGSIELG